MKLVFEDKLTIGEKYKPAMTITNQTDADLYFEACVEHTMRFGKSREEAENIEQKNLAYFAGYYDAETRERVERLFRCAHPIFGKISEHGQPSPEAAFNRGMEMGAKARKGA